MKDTDIDIERIWDEYRSALKAFLHSRVSNSDDVDDLLQEILIKAYKSIGTIRDQDRIQAWLFQIANRTIIDFYRKEGKANKISTADLLADLDTPDANQELAACIRPFINALPAKNAVLLTSIDIEGRSQKEMAAQLDISYSTLKSRVQKSRQELRKLFEACCHISLNRHQHIIDFDPKGEDNCGNC